ncbi:hypothetical protein [Pseudoleptotrichia goodfellowii]|uniref:Uncharacterized protein n=1 Tax=Pseudoleptotrichia goodfellowii TaxID=157692 RepID=A0A510J8S5_9FUSO|nr:hypothetical protein [Pseudoleptotrichia goodfellowii]BBM35476.1 hypothetical protein JCM16774_0389 [Pseudoleptotrichia goodfellowii]
MAKFFIHFRDNVYRLNRGVDRAYFYIHLQELDILNGDETYEVRRILNGYRYKRLFEIEKLKDLISEATEDEYNIFWENRKTEAKKGRN